MLVAACFFSLLGFVLLWRVRTVAPASEERGTVSVIIPARDEEGSIRRLVESLREQEHRPLEIIVVDDDSTDETAARARAAGATVVSGKPLPDGWAGKPWACWQGARQATGDLLLFLDADTWLEPSALGRMCSSFQSDPGLLSVQPYHDMNSAYERLGALFNLITMMGCGAFTMLGSRIAPQLAFGPCVLADREVYFAVGGHERAAGSVVEGAQLAEAFAEAGHPVRCLGGRNTVYFRMYPDGLRSMVGGLAKSFATGAGGLAPWLLIPIIAWVTGAVTTTRHLAIGLATGNEIAIPALVLAGIYAAQMRWMLVRVGNYGWWPAVFFPIPILFFVVVFLLSFFRTFVLGRVSWRGRSVSVG